MPSATPDYPYFKLEPSGDLLPGFGLGSWLSKPGEVEEAVRIALDAGYPLIDTAAIYGNEAEVGEGIRRSKVPRSEIWITTKLWNDAHRPEDVLPAFEKSRKALGVETIDLYLMHYPCAMEPGEEIKVIDISFTETWAAMEALLETGKCRNIGISNFSQAEVETLLASCKVKPAVHQLERHPYLPQHDFIKKHEEWGIHVTAYSPLGNTNPSYAKGDTLPPVLKNAVVTDLAEKYEATPAQILISWQLSSGLSVLPKSTTPKRILENARYVPLAAEDVAKIDDIPDRRRYCDFSEVIGYKYYADLECHID
ncbi:putative aldehyde reductase [Leucosporidium creatinivorum]|uniref:Putative aldehyde reductase n=1 Tax=Leucosporidium creatinivorum TaxID=106004 RepID=A0A1Y2F3U4_9BASI|nr:putative aldehyde reductase [Leucosporidium creatinivorum]